MAPDNDLHLSNDKNSPVKIETEIASVKNEKININNDRFYGLLFLSAVTGISALIGFGSTLAAVRKKDPKCFEEGMIGTKGVNISGASLAMRALGWGSFYAVTGCGILFYGIWKLSGAQNLKDFRQKMGEILPRIPKNDPPQSKTEFEGLNDLLTYISEEWNKEPKKIDE